MEYGAPYQMMAGLSMMLLLYADNLDTVINVRAFVRYGCTIIITATAVTAFSGAYFGQGTGLPILMDNTKCTGSESNLLQCQYDSNTIEDNHGEDAGVRCLKGKNNLTICNT